MKNLLVSVVCVALCVALSACDGPGRKYPRGYTDDGIKFDEDNWRFWPGEERVGLTYFRDDGKSVLTIMCRIPTQFSTSLDISTGLFEPLQQWPQPAFEVSIDNARVSDLPTLKPFGKTLATMSIEIDGREKRQILAGIQSGDPITVALDDQTLEIPGPPQSMREGFARKCRGR